MEERFVRTWRLVSWENRDQDTGEVEYPLGSDAVGFIRYTADAHVFVHIMAADRANLPGDDLFGGSDAEAARAMRTQVSYCGRYQLDGEHVVHRVDVASFPNWVGSEQRRRFEFRNGNLRLSAEGIRIGGRRVSAFLTWEPADG